MAIRYDPRLYTAGTAVFNPNPITQATMMVEAKREAKNQALDNYYRDRLDKINSQGLRDKDLPDFQKNLQDAKTFYALNKDKLRKGDVAAANQYEKMWNAAARTVAESKARTMSGEELKKAALLQRQETGGVSDEIMAAIEDNERAISDPTLDDKGNKRSRAIDAAPYLYTPKPFDLGEELKQYGHITREKSTPVLSATNPETGLRTSTVSETFDDNAKANIYSIAADRFHNNRSFSREINSKMKDPNIVKQLTDVFQSEFGRPAQTPEDMATAYIMSQKDLRKDEVKFEEDKQWAADQKFKRDKELEGIRQKGRMALEGVKQGNRMGLLKARAALKGASKSEQENALDLIYDDLKKESEKPENKWLIKRDGKVVDEYKVAPISPNIRKMFVIETEKDGKKVKNEPTHIGFKPDGTVQIMYSTGEKGGKFGIDKKLTHTITSNEFKATTGKGLGLTGSTTSGANYAPIDEEEDDEEDDEDYEISEEPTSKPKADPLKIF